MTVDDQAAAHLAQVLKLEGFFLEFKAEQVRGVFPTSTLDLYPQEYRLITQGESGRDLFVIYSGRVSVIRPFVAGTEIVLNAGDMFGEIGLVRDGVRTATVIALEESRIFRLTYQDLQYLLSSNPALGEHLTQIAYHRL